MLRHRPVLRERRGFAVAVAAVVLVTGCASTASQNRVARSPVATSSGIVASSPAGACETARGPALTVFNANGSLRWSVSLPAGDGASPSLIAVSDLIVSGHAGSVSAVHSATGATVWSTALGTAIYSLWLVDGMVVANVDQVSSNARLVGLDPRTGKVAWSYRVPGNGFVGDAALTGDGGVAFRTGDAGMLTVIQTATGQVRWSRRVANGPNDGTLPSAASGLVLYVDHSQQIVARDAQTGAVRWQAPAGTTGHVVVSGNAALVMPDAISSPTISVAAHSLDTGAQLWRTDLSASAAAFADPRGFLLIDYRTDTITLVRAGTGARLWRAQIRKIGDLYLAPVTVASTGDITVAEANSVAFIDQNTGHLQQVPTPTNGATPRTAAAGDRLYAALGTKFVVMTAAGASWTAPLPHFAQTYPAPLTDGGVAVQSEDPLCGDPLVGAG